MLRAESCVLVPYDGLRHIGEIEYARSLLGLGGLTG
jgi:hypothetical protein